jgi:hypothetical protein
MRRKSELSNDWDGAANSVRSGSAFLDGIWKKAEYQQVMRECYLYR